MQYKMLRIVSIAVLCFCMLLIQVNAETYFDGGIELIPPDKTVYYEGEMLDLTGIEINEISRIEREFYDPFKDELVKDVQITGRTPLTDVMVDLEGKPLTLEDKIVAVTGKCWFRSGYTTEYFEIIVLLLPNYKTTIVSKDIENGVVEFTVNNGSEEGREVKVLFGIYDSEGNMKCVKSQILFANFGDNSGSFNGINIKNLGDVPIYRCFLPFLIIFIL